MEGYLWGGEGGEGGENVGKGSGNKKHNWQVENRQGEVKNSIGNVEAKEFICMTHEHELRVEGNAGGREECRAEQNKGEKNMGQL